MFEIRLLRLEELKLLKLKFADQTVKSRSFRQYICVQAAEIRLLSNLGVTWQLDSKPFLPQRVPLVFVRSLEADTTQGRTTVHSQLKSSKTMVVQKLHFPQNHRFPYEVLKCLDWQNFKMFPKPSFLYSQTITTTTANRTAGPPWSKPELSIMFQSTAEL